MSGTTARDHISVVLALAIVEMLKASGATQVEARAALAVAKELSYVYLDDVTALDQEAFAKSVSPSPE
jgi:hypothetical protein